MCPRWLPEVACLVLVFGLWMPKAHAGERLVADPRTGCKVYIDSGERPGAGVIWEGVCTPDKYANGEGVLYWTAGTSYDKVYYVAHFSKRGLVMENGHIRKNVTDDAMTLAFNANNKCRSVWATVKSDVDVALGVLDILLDRVVSRYKSECAEEWNKPGSFGINMSHEAVPGVLEGYIDHRTGEKHFSNLGFVANRQNERGEEDERLSRAEDRAKQIAAQTRAAEAAQRQQQAQLTADQKLQAFSDKYGALGWIKWDVLAANPFAREGKVYLFNADFKRMITASSALFNDGVAAIVVSGIPKETFTAPGAILLAGKVQGTTNVKNGLGGDVSIPEVHYLGHVPCHDSTCDGYFTAHARFKGVEGK